MRPKSEAEVAFCALSEGATRWLVEAAAVGTARVRSKMAEAVELAALVGGGRVEEALGMADIAGRFGEGDRSYGDRGQRGDFRRSPVAGIVGFDAGMFPCRVGFCRQLGTLRERCSGPW